MLTVTVVLMLIGVAVVALLGLVHLIERMATRHPDTAVGRICKALNDLIERMPED